MDNLAEVDVHQLSKSYGLQFALRDISFRAAPGSVVGLIGPNGCGKSTLFRLMSGLTRGSGQVHYGGRTLAQHHNPSSVVALTQGPVGTPPRRTLAQHVQLLCRLSGRPLARAREVIEAVGLASVADEYPAGYSYGMMQRAALACAIISRPGVLLLDEPMNGLDPSGVIAVRQFIQDYAEQGHTVFVSSHLLTGLAEMSDQLLVLSRGELLANGPVDELVAAHTETSVRVRSDNDAELRRRLTNSGATVCTDRSGIRVSGCSAAEVGRAARGADIALLELSTVSGSLEDVYLNLLQCTEEYNLELV